MIKLEKQCYHIQNVMYGHANKNIFDKVSDADQDISASTRLQHTKSTQHRDTNTTDNVASTVTGERPINKHKLLQL